MASAAASQVTPRTSAVVEDMLQSVMQSVVAEHNGVNKVVASLLDNLWDEDLTEIRAQLLADAPVDMEQELAQSEQLLADADMLVAANIDVPPPNHVPEPIDNDALMAILQPILTYPPELMSDALKDTLGTVQESHEKHGDHAAIARSRIAQDRQVITDLANQLKGPNDEYRSKLDERRALLDAKRQRLQKKKEGMKESVKTSFEAQREERLAFHRKRDAMLATNEDKSERIRQLKQQIVDTQQQLNKDQQEQDAYLGEARKILQSHADNRLAMFDRLHTEVLPALLEDARLMKEAIGRVADHNAEVVREGRRQLLEKRDQIHAVIKTQTTQLRSLNFTLAMLKRENELADKLTLAQKKKQVEGTARLQQLKKGFHLRKYHTSQPGKSGMRWLRLSDDASYLHYASDSVFSRKFKSFRIEDIVNVFVGPCSPTFSPLRLHQHDHPTCVFSIQLRNFQTLDFAVPPVVDSKTPLQHAALPLDQQRLYAREGETFKRDVTGETFETIVLALQDLTVLYDTNRLPVVTVEKLRWMRYLVGVMLPVDISLPDDVTDVRRKHLRRIFNVELYESRFELIQAKTERDLNVAKESSGEDAKRAIVQESDSESDHQEKGYVTDMLRKEFRSQSSFFKLRERIGSEAKASLAKAIEEEREEVEEVEEVKESDRAHALQEDQHKEEAEEIGDGEVQAAEEPAAEEGGDDEGEKREAKQDGEGEDDDEEEEEEEEWEEWDEHPGEGQEGGEEGQGQGDEGEGNEGEGKAVEAAKEEGGGGSAGDEQKPKKARAEFDIDDLLDRVEGVANEQERVRIAKEALQSGKYGFDCEEALELLDQFEEESKEGFLSLLQQVVTDPEHFDSVVRAEVQDDE